MLDISQSYHPVIPEIPAETLMALPAVQGAALVRRREEAIARELEDPHRYGYQPPIWRLVDLHVAEMRLANPLTVLEILIMGGIRSAKTEFAAARATQHLIHFQTYRQRGDFKAWLWSLAETETSSATIPQARMYKYLPKEFKNEKGSLKHSKSNKLNYGDGTGFTGNQFVVDGRLADFKFYGAKDASFQGAELTMAWSDELVPKAVVKTVRDRLNTRAKDTGTPQHKACVRECYDLLKAGKALTPEQIAQLYLGVHIITFTPKEGYSDTVAEFLDGARNIETVPAELLPIFSGKAEDGEEADDLPDDGPTVKRIIGYEQVPRVKQAKKGTRRVFYFHTADNAYGNYEGLAKDLEGARADTIRIDAYGDVRKSWHSKFPKFRDTVHVIKLGQVPKKGTWYHVCDPCDNRNWFMTWWLVVGGESPVHYCVRQWPMEGDDIPGVGDPGVWAEGSGTQKKADGVPGPAQKGFGLTLREYKAEVDRVEKELGEWFYGKEAGRSIEPAERHMDSRFGERETPKQDETTTLIEECEELDLFFLPASGKASREGETLINDKLGYDDAKPVTSLNHPHLYVVEHCEGVIYSLQNWTGKDGLKGACKDPKDNIVYHLLSSPEDTADQPLMLRRARGL